MEYLNWYNSGWQGGFIAKQGYYSPVPETAKKFLTQAEWDYWYEGKPAAVDIKDPYGNLMEKKGAVRDGGSLWEREGQRDRLEHRDGRGPLSDAAMERLHLGLSRRACCAAGPRTSFAMKTTV